MTSLIICHLQRFLLQIISDRNILPLHGLVGRLRELRGELPPLWLEEELAVAQVCHVDGGCGRRKLQHQSPFHFFGRVFDEGTCRNWSKIQELQFVR